MQIYKKSLHNFLQKHQLLEETSNWRDLSTYTLLQILSDYQIPITEELFLLYADAHDSPESLALFFTHTLSSFHEKEGKKEKTEQSVYLVVFELWRRLLPHKQTVSLFCDELDYHLSLYEQNKETSLEPILLRLKEILEENVDLGAHPKDAFYTLSHHAAHNLEVFLYDYISHQIENKNTSYATELLDDFFPYMLDENWFLFLKARLSSLTDPHEANLTIQALLETLEKEDNLDLLLEISSFLISHGDPHLFLKAANLAFSLIQNEEDFQELLAIVADYFRCLDREKEQKEIEHLFIDRKSYPLTKPIHPSDQAVTVLKDHLENLLEDA